MNAPLMLLLGAAAAGCTLLLAATLLRHGRLDRDPVPAGRAAAFTRELANNALGLLLIGSLAAASGLLAAGLDRLLQVQG